MNNLKNTTAEFINSILGIICLEKGLSKNTKIAYISDISSVFEWFESKNVNFLFANEKNFRELFYFLQKKIINLVR